MGLNMYETVKKILIDDLQIEDSEIKPESELINDLGINSLELADLVMNCEDKLGIEIKTKKSATSLLSVMLFRISKKL